MNPPPTPLTWSRILARAYALFDDLEAKGFGSPPFALGGGNVAMLRFRHRLSKDIDFFGYDARWLSLLSPRLNEAAAAISSSYAEQANTVKIVTSEGDIDFVIAGDIARPVVRETARLEGRDVLLDPTSEILAKKLFYRAASLKPRDVYDLAAAIDLDPASARLAARAAAPRRDVLLRRLRELATAPPDALREGLIPYGGRLPHFDGMAPKAFDFLAAAFDAAGPHP